MLSQLFGASGSSREPMSKVDTAWLRMERPTNLMMITGVMVFDGKLDISLFRRTIRDRFLSYRRFTQRPVQSAGNAYWERDPNFDIESHLHRRALPGAAGKAELQQFVSDLASTPLDQSKPMWQFHLIDNYVEGNAVVVRIHHCYADGIALVQVLLSMTDGTQTPTRRARTGKFDESEAGVSVLRRLYEPARQRVGSLLDLGGKVWDEGSRVLRDPSRAAGYLEGGVDVASEFARALMLGNDSKTRLKGRLGVQKRVAWAGPLALDQVKTVAKSLGCTVNDVLVASVAGALGSYLAEKGDDLNGTNIRATVPVNLRPLDHAKQLGNHFGLVFLDLPIGEHDPLKRVYLVKRSMDALKSSRQAVATFGFLELLGYAPHSAQQTTLDVLSHKASAVLTNVPGPQKSLYLAGSRISEQMFWVPQSGNIGVGVSILSYDGCVHFGLIVDKNLVRNPDAVVSRFRTEFEELVLCTLMAPWEEPWEENEETSVTEKSVP